MEDEKNLTKEDEGKGLFSQWMSGEILSIFWKMLVKQI